jgi:hypothetical protein
MLLDDYGVLPWIALMALVGLCCVLLAAWDEWRQWKRKRDVMRRFWSERRRRGGR